MNDRTNEHNKLKNERNYASNNECYDAILICKFLTVKHFFDNYEMKFGQQ